MTPILINCDGGTAARLGDRLDPKVRAAFEAAGTAIDLRLLPGKHIAAAAQELADQPLVVVGGGDGTLGGAAGMLAPGGAALGILPLGTRNHLARELGVPLDLPGAATLIAAGTTRCIDLASVNGHAFVNNASVGIYPALVRAREVEQDRRGVPKWLAAVPASYMALKRLRHHRLRLSLPTREEAVVTPLLFVGNNRYSLDRGRIGQRETLDDGTLSVFAVASRHRRALIGFAIRTLAGRADPARDFAAIGETAALTVAGGSHHIDIAIDGEVVRLAMPLRFAIEPQALTVVAPLEGAPATA